MGVRTSPLGPYFKHVNEETSFMPTVYFNVETPPIAHFWLHRWLLEYHSTSLLTFFNLTTKMTFISCVILSNSPNSYIFPFCSCMSASFHAILCSTGQIVMPGQSCTPCVLILVFMCPTLKECANTMVSAMA